MRPRRQHWIQESFAQFFLCQNGRRSCASRGIHAQQRLCVCDQSRRAVHQGFPELSGCSWGLTNGSRSRCENSRLQHGCVRQVACRAMHPPGAPAVRAGGGAGTRAGSEGQPRVRRRRRQYWEFPARRNPRVSVAGRTERIGLHPGECGCAELDLGARFCPHLRWGLGDRTYAASAGG